MNIFILRRPREQLFSANFSQSNRFHGNLHKKQLEHESAKPFECSIETVIAELFFYYYSWWMREADFTFANW